MEMRGTGNLLDNTDLFSQRLDRTDAVYINNRRMRSNKIIELTRIYIIQLDVMRDVV